MFRIKVFYLCIIENVLSFFLSRRSTDVVVFTSAAAVPEAHPSVVAAAPD